MTVEAPPADHSVEVSVVAEAVLAVAKLPGDGIPPITKFLRSDFVAGSLNSVYHSIATLQQRSFRVFF